MSDQTTIFGESINEQFRVETSGRVIRPWVRMVKRVASEARLEFDSDGIYTRMVDPANVLMINTWIHDSAFDEFEVRDIEKQNVFGVNMDVFGSVLRHARYGKRTDDDVTFFGDSRKLETETSRELDGSNVEITERMGLVDPGSIRGKQEIPEWESDAMVNISPSALSETIKMFKDKKVVGFELDGELIVSRESDTRGTAVTIGDFPGGQMDETLFSSDYLQDIAWILDNGYVDSVSLKLKEEYPLRVEFEREGVYEGQILLSPRISN